MKLRFLVLIAAILFSSLSSAQKSIHDYHYIFVPDQFEFLKGKDQYQVNSLVRFLFKKHGFNAYIGDELPLALKKQPCKGLYADVQGMENFMHTKVQISIKDCYGEVLFTSPEGKSKDKNYRKAYHGAVREAFEAIAALNVKQLPLAVLDDVVDQLDEEEAEVETEEAAEVEVEEQEEAPVAIELQGDLDAEVIEAVKVIHLVYKDYELIKKGRVYQVLYKGEQIGTAEPTQEANVYKVNTTQFTGMGYEGNEAFRLERAIEGLDQTITMLFKSKQ